MIIDKVTYAPPVLNTGIKAGNVKNTYQETAIAENTGKGVSSALTPQSTASSNTVNNPIKAGDISQLYRVNSNTAIGRAQSVNDYNAASLQYKATMEENASYEKMLKRIGNKVCETCQSRQYQDVSTDPGVSFKSPTHISPGNAASAVSAHEQEHVQNEQARAKSEKREVISQSVRKFTSVCPECGKVYVSGGETRTVTASIPESANYSELSGKMMDAYA